MKNESSLQLIDFYFTKVDFKQKRQKHHKVILKNIQIGYALNPDKTQICVTVDTVFRNKGDSIVLEMETVAEFKLNQIDMTDKNTKHLIEINTLAIMFPYIRSQASLVTTQPGLEPIQLPLINVEALLEEAVAESPKAQKGLSDNV
ncbi:protein-export chaperone SecB [uncultured Ruminococcus sp.]|uniref:protein-export chaperone SecB n=1 Tax=uncultured Ruminococcus sp. TaxID=165186 RepID=UPI00292D56B2|nr:protein-export chaperone SecB [uncultured Ruminococcus sp.]